MNIREIIRNRRVVVLAAAGLVVLVFIFTRPGCDKDDADHVEITATRGIVQPTILATGTVSPENRLEIKPPINGRIDEILIKEGDVVKKGQELVRMSSTERAAVLDAARSQGDEELKRWETYYHAAPIMAPIDGTVIVKSAENGQTVTSQDVLMVISDRLTVKARVDETDIGKIRLRQRADIILDAYPGETIPGAVDKIAFDSKTVSNVTTYVVDVLPDNLPDTMRSGMTANVNFYLDSKNDVLNLPASAIRMRDGRNYVLMKTKKPKKPMERFIETGISDGNRVEVTKGLEEDEIVLIDKIKWVEEGRKSNLMFPSGSKKK